MKKRTLALLLCLAMTLAFAASCGGNDPAATSPTPAASPSASPTQTAPTTFEFTDSAGRTVTLPTDITRIAPSGSLAQMYLIAIAPDLLCTIASTYTEEELKYIPDGINDLPEVGHFYGSDDLNIESVAAIAPDVVIDIGEPKGSIVEDMDSITESLAIPAIHITATLNSSPDAFRTLGQILNREEEGERLAQYCERILEQSRDIMDSVGDNKIPALYCLGDMGMNVLAATSFHAETLDMVTNNLAIVDSPSSRGSGNETDMEQLIVWDPDVIIFAPDSVYSTVADDPVWSLMKAIQNGNYYEVPYGPYNWMNSPPSINRYLGLQWLTKLLYPEFATFDLYESVREYYDLFYHYDLSQADFDALTANSFPR